ncbi:MAG TPA: NPCBM/NEW2 domain-containing protein [Actinomycetota bacterium]
MTERRIIAALAIACLVLLGMLAWVSVERLTDAPDQTDLEFWVSTTGDDGADGSRSAPWATLQHAADTATPGVTVYVEEGTYAQRFEVMTSGRPGMPITFTTAPEAHVVLDGTTLEVPADQSAMVTIDGQHDVAIEGFDITGYASDVSGHVPVGIFITGASDTITIRGNHVHDMGTTFQGRSGGDAHGIAVYGTDADHPIEDITILGNELDHLTLGSSEALVVNGNVRDFLIEGNRVHDTNNIGIDVIGFEGVAPDPTVDQARDGIVRGNEIWNIDSFGNPAYGNSRSADGVYVDGGRDVLIEANVIRNVNIGIELASEHAGRATRSIVARNNVVVGSTTIGIAIGGYDRRRGSTESCQILHNTVVDTQGPSLLVQFDTRDNVIANNIIVVGPDPIFVENPYVENDDNVLDHNLYFAPGGSSRGAWQWKDEDFTDFDAWRSGSGVDEHSSFADPRFVDAASGDYRLQPSSPAVDAGTITPSAGELDAAGEPRLQAGSPDLGAYEVTAPPPSPTPRIEASTAVADLDWSDVENGWGPPEIDRSNGEKASDDGGPIVIGGVAFPHGIGVHAPASITLALDGRCTLFLADVGVDDEVDGHGSVTFVVRGDGQMLATSGVVRGGQAPVPMSADVTGVDGLMLGVTPARDGNGFDHADWANARLSCG